jgi:hypothetical protein
MIINPIQNDMEVREMACRQIDEKRCNACANAIFSEQVLGELAHFSKNDQKRVRNQKPCEVGIEKTVLLDKI